MSTTQLQSSSTNQHFRRSRISTSHELFTNDGYYYIIHISAALSPLLTTLHRLWCVTKTNIPFNEIPTMHINSHSQLSTSTLYTYLFTSSKPCMPLYFPSPFSYTFSFYPLPSPPLPFPPLPSQGSHFHWHITRLGSLWERLTSHSEFWHSRAATVST